MKVTETKLPGVLIIEPKVYEDSRGFFKETYQSKRYKDVGIDYTFVQDNYSCSNRGVVRGLHFQVNKPQGKLVTCPRGAVFDVAVDISPASSTFGEYVGIELTEENHKQLWIPPGYAHGFCITSETADFLYKCTEYYDPNDENGVIWNDPTINIKWPNVNYSLSSKDMALPMLTELTLKK